MLAKPSISQGRSRTRLAVAAVSVGATMLGGVFAAGDAYASVRTLIGSVHGADGKAVAGAKVQFNAFAVGKVGIKTETIATTTTDSSGDYTLPMPTANQLAALASVDDGTVNYQIITTGSSGGNMQFADTTFPASEMVSGALVPHAHMARQAAGNLSLTMSPLKSVKGIPVRASVVSPKEGCIQPSEWVTVSSGDTYQAIVGELHDDINMWLSFTYTTGASLERDTGAGADYSGGINFNGAGLSTDTSYSSDVTYRWDMNSNTSNPHYLFGNEQPPTIAPIIYSN